MRRDAGGSGAVRLAGPSTQRLLVALAAVASVGAVAWWSFVRTPSGPASVEAVDPGPVRWLKGQTHAHSNRSGDSETPPEAVARWYAAHGYDFLVFTDHDAVTSLGRVGSLLTIPGVELTQNLRSCLPREDSASFCPLHVNALFVERQGRTSVPQDGGLERLDRYTAAMATTAALGAVAQLNHPNYEYGAASGALLTELSRRGARFVEVANEASDSNNAGDATHPSTEQLWDDALSQGARLYAVATDDAHHYDDADAVRARGDEAFPGDLGFVVVRARHDASSIRQAMEAGDFYASTGVWLETLERTATTLTLGVTGTARFELIGRGGRVLEQQTGARATFSLAAIDGYVRVRVTDPSGRRAWTQPVWPS
jgi:hypothetical protein